MRRFTTSQRRKTPYGRSTAPLLGRMLDRKAHSKRYSPPALDPNLSPRSSILDGSIAEIGSGPFLDGSIAGIVACPDEVGPDALSYEYRRAILRNNGTTRGGAYRPSTWGRRPHP
jgi:hypothetical protein